MIYLICILIFIFYFYILYKNPGEKSTLIHGKTTTIIIISLSFILISFIFLSLSNVDNMTEYENISKRNKDIRKFLNVIEKTILETLKEYKIKSIADRKNIGIWIKHKKKIKKVGAIGIRVKKWIAYHGFSINVKTDLKYYDKIIPCGIKNKEIINLRSIKKQSYNDLRKKIIKNFINNLKI